MEIRKRRIKQEDKVFQILFLVFISLFLSFLVYSNFKLEKKKRELNQKIDELKFKIEKLQLERNKLEGAISQMQKDNYWEELAREEGYVREGEEAIVIKKVEGEKEKEKERSWWKFWEEFKNFFRK